MGICVVAPEGVDAQMQLGQVPQLHCVWKGVGCALGWRVVGANRGTAHASTSTLAYSVSMRPHPPLDGVGFSLRHAEGCAGAVRC